MQKLSMNHITINFRDKTENPKSAVQVEIQSHIDMDTIWTQHNSRDKTRNPKYMVQVLIKSYIDMDTIWT